YGGEFFAAIDVGGKPALELNFYQPLTYDQRFFIEPLYSRKRQDIGIYNNDKRVAEYELDTSFTELTLGRNLGVYGQTKFGWRDYHMRGSADISTIVLPNINENY